ncbi:hypothetical protein CK203_112258 [Vitis vinifera]|uniref:Retrotransposon gag domain-containing protein n=1 Tax=Vitis vinifera TaxID=29760 RepID=A0A438CNV7_VITVI|nr:hypothetical protein CK203_112258 [Vitis vinifera]
MEALAVHMETRNQEIHQELAIYKTTMSARVMATHEAPRVEVPKPHTLSGKRDAKELDNFLWHMERYFEAIALIDEATKVCTVTLCLTDNATLWWRRQFADIEKGTKSMKRLKHKGSIREYVKEFSTLMLEIPNMAEEELLFNFMDNLQRETPPSQSHHLRVTRPKVRETRDREATLLRKDQAKALVARMAKARISGRVHAQDQLLPVRWSTLGTGLSKEESSKCYDRGK